MFLAWPLAIFIIRDRAADKGLYPDGDSQPPAENHAESHTFGLSACASIRSGSC